MKSLRQRNVGMCKVEYEARIPERTPGAKGHEDGCHGEKNANSSKNGQAIFPSESPLIRSQ